MKKVALIFIALILCTLSCQKNEIDSPTPQSDVSTLQTENLIIAGSNVNEKVLGKKRKNPYSIDNMKMAYSNLKKINKSFPNLLIKENYFYVRFLPKDDGEYNTIASNESLDLYEYPLEYELKSSTGYYKDPSTTGNKYTWFYTSVPIEFVFPKNIKYEILEKLYLPKGNGNSKGLDYKKQFSESIEVTMKDIEQEALRISGNLKTKNTKITADWRPYGTIKVNDTNLGVIPVVGCKVKITNGWFKNNTVYTNNIGFFDAGDYYGGSVKYKIVWDREDFDIRSGNYGQAETNSYDGNTSFTTLPWNITFSNVAPIDQSYQVQDYLYAIVHRAAMIYFYQSSTWGILPPPSKNYFASLGVLSRLFGHKLHLAVSESTSRAHYFDINDNFFAAEVKLPFRTTQTSRSIFETSIHEMAHASHWKIGFSTTLYLASLNNRKLAESWAQAVGWQVTNSIYGNFPDPFFDDAGLQSTTLAWIQSGPYLKRMYTPLFVDLIDNFNQSTRNFGDSIFPTDNANGYTLGQLEGFLKKSPGNWTQYKNCLRDNSTNVTETQALQLFDNYDD